MRLLYFLIFSLNSFVALSQCQVDTYIEANYTLDAKILALRAVLADSSDPDYDNPFLPDNRITPYLELLSGIYENPNNNSEIAELFDFFNFHVNQEINQWVEFKTMAFSVDTSLPWVENFKNTGVSGISELDNLIITYQFEVSDFWDLSSCGCTIFFIETGYEFLNLYALVDNFEAIADLEYAEVFSNNEIDYRLNYSGEPYDIVTTDETSPAYACDILVEYDSVENNYLFSFVLYGGDCFAGCTVSETRIVEIDENCQPLSTKETTFNQLMIYPNPTTQIVNFSTKNGEPISVILYDLNGRSILSKTLSSNSLDVSNLQQGVYLLRINQKNLTQIKKVVIK